MDYTAVGQTTHLAARMEQIGRCPGAILVTAETLPSSRVVSGQVAGRRSGQGAGRACRGLRADRCAGPPAGASRPRPRGGSRASSGRQAELDSSAQALERAGAGHGQVVAPSGSPVWASRGSSGSSRTRTAHRGGLSWKAAPSPTARRPAICRSSISSRRYFQIEDRDGTAKIREKITGKLLALDRALEPAAARLARPPRCPGRGSAVGSASTLPSGGSGRSRPSSGCSCARARCSPSCSSSRTCTGSTPRRRRVLDSLVESLPAGPHSPARQLSPRVPARLGQQELLQAAPGRPAAAPGRRGAPRRSAGRRSDTASRSSACSSSAPRATRSFSRRACGLSSRQGAGGRARSLPSGRGRPTALHVPATVQALLAARIDRLPAEEKRLLQAASVIGKDVPLVLLHAIAGGGRAGLGAEVCRDLQAAEFLYETSLFPDVEYTFKHALTHEVAYGELASRAPPASPRADRPGDRAAVSGTAGRARRGARPPCPAG